MKKLNSLILEAIVKIKGIDYLILKNDDCEVYVTIPKTFCDAVRIGDNVRIIGKLVSSFGNIMIETEHLEIKEKDRTNNTLSI